MNLCVREEEGEARITVQKQKETSHAHTDEDTAEAVTHTRRGCHGGKAKINTIRLCSKY